MKELLKQYAEYNVWANQRITNLALTLPEEVVQKDIDSSFRSIHLTLLHVWDAEQIWWQRVKLSEQVDSIFKKSFSTKDVVAGLVNQSKQWEEWVSGNTVAGLEHVFAYQNSKKEQFKQPIWQMLLHTFNHGTYHRGQIVTMLRQVGVEVIPSTDFIAFCRGGTKK